MPYKFLTDEWVAEAKKVRDEFEGQGAPPAHTVRMNQIITDVPFGDGTVNVHLDTSSGDVDLDLGHLENPDLTVTLDYETAKAIIVDQNPQAGMQAFMAGKIKFGAIARLVEATINEWIRSGNLAPLTSADDAISVDHNARNKAASLLPQIALKAS